MVTASYDLPDSELAAVDAFIAKGQGPEVLLDHIAHFIGPAVVRQLRARVA
jgi:hypothetical protein